MLTFVCFLCVAGTEEYDRIRRLSFEKADVFVICYSVDNMASFEHVESKWVPEIRSYDESVPIFMLWYVRMLMRFESLLLLPLYLHHNWQIGFSTKIDLREDTEFIAKIRADGGEVTRALGRWRL